MLFKTNVAGFVCGYLVLMAGTVQAQSAPAGLVDKLQKNGCAGCHALDKKLVGPAIKDVAARYKNDKNAESKLAQKIMAGGSGNWGAIPMPPQKLKEDELKAFATLILQVK